MYVRSSGQRLYLAGAERVLPQRAGTATKE